MEQTTKGVLLRKSWMLILDTFYGHLTPEIKVRTTSSCMNTYVVIIPGGVFSQLRMLGVMVNKPFKEYLKWLCSEWLMTGNQALPPAGRIKMPIVMLFC
jgi:hypothetical protein